MGMGMTAHPTLVTESCSCLALLFPSSSLHLCIIVFWVCILVSWVCCCVCGGVVVVVDGGGCGVGRCDW